MSAFPCAATLQVAIVVESKKKIRILLADDHPTVRRVLSHLLGCETNIEVVGEASDGQMAVELTQALLPDVVIMDVRMPQMSGIEATHRIVSQHPNVRVIGLSIYHESRLSKAMREAGAVDYFCKDEPIEALITAISTHCRAGQD